MSEEAFLQLSESIQMYLVTIARLREDGLPVPLSELARELSVSPVSVNEMCRKLQDQGLVTYWPYKGALLTPEGERRALYILRRHRLWEVLLVDKLGLSYGQAHEAACHLEHTTPELVADRLDVYLGHPAVNPVGQSIPRPDGSLPTRQLIPLSSVFAGQRGHVVRCDVTGAVSDFLHVQGLRPGVTVTVLAKGETNLLVQVNGAQIALMSSLAEAIWIEPEDQRAEETILRRDPQKEEGMKAKSKAQLIRIPLSELQVGRQGVVVRVGGEGSAKRRMMDMGLVPGAKVEVLRVAPLGDPIEFDVRGYGLSLRKSEAKSITVEVSVENA